MDDLLNKYIKVSTKKRINSSKLNKFDWQFLCGRNVNCIKAIGFEKIYNFKDNKGFYEGDVESSSKPYWQNQIYVAAKALLQLVDPHFIGDHDGFFSLLTQCRRRMHTNQRMACLITMIFNI